MKFNYSVTITKEDVGYWSPIMLRGGIMKNMKIAHELGYDAVELQMRNPLDMEKDEILAYMKETGIKISALATGLEYGMNKLSMIADTEEERNACINRLYEYVDLAKELNTGVIIGCIRGNMSGTPSANHPKWDVFRDSLKKVCEYGAKFGVDIYLEAINFYVNNYLCNVHETVDFIKSMNIPNLKIHIDTHHMSIEDKDMIESVKYTKGVLGYVHFCENNRKYPGANGVDFEGCLKALKEIDYKGFISFECVPYPNELDSAVLGLKYCKETEKNV